MSRKTLLGIGLVVVLLVSLAAPALVQTFTCEFSADYVQTAFDGTQTTGKIFVSADKIRQEMVQGGQQIVSIVRLDQKIIWVLMPLQKMYTEFSLEAAQGSQLPQYQAENDDLIAEKKDLGTETVNGYVCHKYQITYKDATLGTAIQWIADDLNFPIKTEQTTDEGTMVAEYNNIVEGSQSASLFEIPDDYKKFAFSMPSSND